MGEHFSGMVDFNGIFFRMCRNSEGHEDQMPQVRRCLYKRRGCRRISDEIKGTHHTPLKKISFPLLGDSGSRINILFWGDIKLKTGKKIKVHGVCRKMMEMGKYPLRDVIEASEIETEMKTQEKNP